MITVQTIEVSNIMEACREWPSKAVVCSNRHACMALCVNGSAAVMLSLVYDKERHNNRAPLIVDGQNYWVKINRSLLSIKMDFHYLGVNKWYEKHFYLDAFSNYISTGSQSQVKAIFYSLMCAKIIICMRSMSAIYLLLYLAGTSLW